MGKQTSETIAAVVFEVFWISQSSGAPNDQFVEKCIIIPQLMKIYVIKAFSGKNLSVPFSQEDTQEISQPGR